MNVQKNIAKAKSDYLTEKTMARIERRDEILAQLCSLPVVFSEDDAKQAVKGLKSLSNSKFSRGDWEKLQGLSIKAFGKTNKEGKIKIPIVVKEAFPEREQQLALTVMAKALSMINDGLFGKHNDIMGMYGSVQKAFHTESAIDLSRAILELNTATDEFQMNNIDSGWMNGFTMVDARGRQSVSVTDLVSQLQFKQIGYDEVPKPQGLDQGEKKESIGRRQFGAAFAVHDYDKNFAIWTVNDFLRKLRVASLITKTNLGYRILLEETSSQKLIEKYTPGTAKEDIMNAAVTLNQAYIDVMTQAGNIDMPQAKGKVKRKEAPLTKGFTSAVLAYYHPIHEAFIQRLRKLTVGDDGVNDQIVYPFIWVPSFSAPASGAYKLRAGTAQTRDEYTGIYGTYDEVGHITAPSVHLVIPKLRNLFITYEDMVMDKGKQPGSREEITYAFEQYNAVKDLRQSKRVVLGK